MIDERENSPSEDEVGTANSGRPKLWFPRQLEIYLFGEPPGINTKPNKPKSGKCLILPWFSKQLEIYLFGKPKARRKAAGQPRLTIPWFSKQLEIYLFGEPPKAVRPLVEPVAAKPLVIPLIRPQAVLAGFLVFAGLAGAFSFGQHSNRPAIPGPSSAAFAPPAPLVEIEQRGLTPAAPKQLRIPVIGVNTSFVELGKEADGTIEVPDRFDIAGWYKRAPTPGEIGPAIILGHVDNYWGPAVFYRLGELKAGDIIEIDRVDNTSLKFRVEAVKQFPQDNFPTQEVYGNIDHAGLRLITCSGQFNQASDNYTHNTVVFASQII